MANYHSSDSEESQFKRQRTSSDNIMHEELEESASSSYSSSLHSALSTPSLGGHANGKSRAATLRKAQATYGNRAVQRHLGLGTRSSRVAIQRWPAFVGPYLENVWGNEPRQQKEQTTKTVRNITGALDTGKQAAEVSLGDDLPRGYASGSDMLSEFMNRMAGGQGSWEALGGGLTKGLLGGLTGSDMFKNSVGKTSRVGGMFGLVGSGMKLLGSLLGEEDKDMGVGDAGEYISTGATLISPPALAAQGIQEGGMGAYNTLQSVADFFVTGNSDKFMKQGDDQLRGKSGTITQGYSMISDVIGSLVTGDKSELHRISEMAAAGELGALPQRGDHMGEEWFEMGDRPDGFGAAFSDMAEFLWEGAAAAGKGGIKGAARWIGEGISDGWDSINGPLITPEIREVLLRKQEERARKKEVAREREIQSRLYRIMTRAQMGGAVASADDVATRIGADERLQFLLTTSGKSYE